MQVWTCGCATLLTRRPPGPDAPRDPAGPDPVALAEELLTAYPDRLYWYGCRGCSNERGALDHLPQVVLRPPGGYPDNVAAADRTLVLGVAR